MQPGHPVDGGQRNRWVLPPGPVLLPCVRGRENERDERKRGKERGREREKGGKTGEKMGGGG